MADKVLTEERILKKCKVHSLADVKNLNDYAVGCSDISIVSQLENVEVVTLSANEISTLEPFSKCKHLKELYLRHNKIESLGELYYLKDLPNLRVLWLSDNPIASKNEYRNFSISLLPQITKLDETDVSPEERAKAIQTISNPESIAKSPLSSSRTTERPHSGVAPKSHSMKITNIPNNTQRHILAAISNLLLELDRDSLEVLLDQINSMRQ